MEGESLKGEIVKIGGCITHIYEPINTNNSMFTAAWLSLHHSDRDTSTYMPFPFRFSSSCIIAPAWYTKPAPASKNQKKI